MRILVIGLDCAAPEILFSDERLTNVRRLMAAGCYGRLETIIPPITVPAWMCMATSQDPGSLGVYGFRNRRDHSYTGLGIVNSQAIRQWTIWDQIARAGKRSTIIGVPPSYPPRPVNGICIGCCLTPDPQRDVFTHPATVKETVTHLVGDYPVDIKAFRRGGTDSLAEEIYAMSRKHFAVVRHLLRGSQWEYFQFVEIGLDRLQHGFWKYHDPQHILHPPGNPHTQVIRDYYRYLDYEIGTLLELLDGETAILVMSDHGAQRLDGGFCINEWLIRQCLLTLNQYPKEMTPFSHLDVNWEQTRVWGEGGYYARLFLNVKGREPRGVIDKADYETFRDEVKDRLEATVDDTGASLNTRVFKPEEIYQTVNGIAPDLIAYFGDLSWRSIGGVGYQAFHVQEDHTGPDGCNHSQFGTFILASPNCTLRGETTSAHILDLAPALLELGGYDIPDSMQGRSLIGGHAN